jgi:hypothetical protein
MKARGGTVLAWSLYELGATSFAMNLLSLHLPLDIAGRVTRGSEKFSLAFKPGRITRLRATRDGFVAECDRLADVFRAMSDNPPA